MNFQHPPLNAVQYIISTLAIAMLALSACKGPQDKELVQEPTLVNKPDTPLFAKVPPEKSKLTFSNTLTHNVATRENLFDYDYFYNGAGVGIEDLNNDGLPDLFFCGNQVPNQLYLNKGDLVFEDISETADINQRKTWANGVTFADVNQDGWMDIYVSQGGPVEREDRRNLLYINKQDGTFTEMAAEYGLDDPGISTQSAFFDFDKDGDLDCVVMNENELYGVDPINLDRLVSGDAETRYFNSSHLYRNDNGKFVDITRQAGLERPIFGLGLAISDLNDDGWPDIYMASDYYLPDALFINNGDGSFTDEIKTYTQQVSYYGMGVDIADINNDNLQDIFVLDMASSDHVRSKTLMASMSTGRFDYLTKEAGFQYQYMYNSFQLNLGQNKYSNIAQLTGTANTDWSWAVIFSDFDLDEDKDMYVTNGYRRYALDNDLQNKVFDAKRKYGNQVPLHIKEALYNAMPSEKLPNILYENRGNLKFENRAEPWGLADFSFSNGAAVGDLDNDGDLDIVVNNMDEHAFLYRNQAVEEKRGHFLKVKTVGKVSDPLAKVYISYGGKSQSVENRRVRGYMSALEHTAHFGLGGTEKIDTVRVIWPNGKREERYGVPANATLTFRQDEAREIIPENKSTQPFFTEVLAKNYGLDFEHKENAYDDFETEVLLPYKQSGLGPYMASADVNGDGLDDIYIGGASGQAGSLFLQDENGFRKKAVSAFTADNVYEDMQAVFFDLDGDGDKDLYVVSGGYEFAEHSSLYADRIYLNDGKGNFERQQSEALSTLPKSGKAVIAFDYDKDGDDDILVGNRIIPRQYPQFSPSVLYENVSGELRAVSSEKVPALHDFGMINSLQATDFNKDGWTDFIAVGEWTGIGIFENRQGSFTNITASNEMLKKSGWWFSVSETDINNDGWPDYILGNVGLNLKFKASPEKPFKIYATDFDDNGTNDIVLSKKYHDTYVPVRGRECSSQQMPFIQQKFPTYSDFAHASLTDIYGEKLEQSYVGEVTEFRSLLLLNRGNGTFETAPLPIEAQVNPILSCEFFDLNGDGFQDAILAGNIYETEVETPRLDGWSGQVLLSNGKDAYLPLPFTQSGLYLTGNVKDLITIATRKGPTLISAQNNGPLQVYSPTSPLSKLDPNPLAKR